MLYDDNSHYEGIVELSDDGVDNHRQYDCAERKAIITDEFH